MATKKLLSQDPVRQSTFSLSAKASDILQVFSNPPNTDTALHQWSTGLIYFRGYPRLDVDHWTDNHDKGLSEVIGLCPEWLLTSQRGDKGTTLFLDVRDASGDYQRQMIQDGDFLSQLQQHYTPHAARSPAPASVQASDPAGFCGGLAGFIGYDLTTGAALAHTSSGKMHDTADKGQHAQHAASLLGAMGYYDIYLKHSPEGWVLYGPADDALQPIYQHISTLLQPLIQRSGAELVCAAAHPLHVTHPFKAVWQKADYIEAFAQVQRYLQAGDCYQVNLTQPFVAQVKGDLLATLDTLMALTQAPYSGYMRVGGHELLSCSPELFLAFTGTAPNRVITRPIKGTFPRSNDPTRDLDYKHQLMTSEKDHSENLMIVDLLRNDLSKHALTGSVEVPVLFQVESFAQVHHLVSEVRATLAPEASALDVLLAALPGGSITGAPKKRAMEIIAELEAAPRGGYCGSMGYLNRDGSGQFNILIRTLQKQGDDLVAWAGGGITVASDVDAEYQECMDKIKAILDCINQFQSA